MKLIPDRKFGTIYIRKRSVCEWLVLMLFMLPFTFALLTEVLGLPDVIRFSLDVILVSIFAIMILSGRFIFQTKIKPLLIMITVFFIYTLIAYMFNFQSLFYYIWGLRNNFRFYVAFFIFIVYVGYDDVEQWFRFLDVLFWINFATSLFQFFFLGIQQDYLGGIFGSTGGTNGFTQIFFCIIITKSLLSTFEGNESIFSCILKSIATLLVAAMAEMKFYYIIFIIILILTSFLTKFSRKKFIMLTLSIVGVILSSSLLTILFGFEDFLSIGNLWEFATKENYASDRDLNRFSAIFTLSKVIMTESAERLFGLGLGNCDVSDLSIFNTPFYQNYGYLHYTWFTGPMLFLETGFVGLAFYMSFFFYCFGYSIAQLKRKAGNVLYNQLTIVISIMCVIITFYNSSLRIESAYMVYFVLALPFLDSNSSSSGVL